MIENVKPFFSTPFVIMITFALLILFFNMSVESNPHNMLAPVTTTMKNWIHNAIFPSLLGYWIAAFFINRL